MIPLRDINPLRQRPPVVTVTVIVLNALFFFYELALGPRLEEFLYRTAFIPAVFFGDHGGVVYGAVAGFLSRVLPGGWAHIIGNMLYLWIFGDNVEDYLGHFGFAAFYLVTGYVATFAQAVASPASQVPSIGASGAISGVLGAYLLLHPRARIVTLIFLGFFFQIVEVPALVYLPLWFLMQFFSGVASLVSSSASDVHAGGVAFFAHIGGFASGVGLLWILGGRPSKDQPAPPPPRPPAHRFPDL
jgi:membrane associated rhomboid family serine protease